MKKRRSFHRGYPGALVVIMTVMAIPVAGLPAGISAQELFIPEPTPLMPGQSQIAEISDEELFEFATAMSNIQDINEQMQKATVQIIEDSELSPERFVELLQSNRTPGAEDAVDASAAEKEEFDSVVQEIAEMQKSSQERMAQAVLVTRLTAERFNEILILLQADSTLAERVRQQIGGERY